ncbi:unnamed protein product [Closterium sp. NIES-54]
MPPLAQESARFKRPPRDASLPRPSRPSLPDGFESDDGARSDGGARSDVDAWSDSDVRSDDERWAEGLLDISSGADDASPPASISTASQSTKFRCMQCGSSAHPSWLCDAPPPAARCAQCSAKEKGKRPLPCPDVATALNRIASCRATADVAGMHAAIDGLQRAGHRPPLEAFSQVIATHATLGEPEKAEAVLAEMEAAGVAADPVCYNAVVNAFCSRARVDEALTVLRRMRFNGWEPTASTYNTLIKGFGAAKRPEDAAKVAEMMVGRAGAAAGRRKGGRSWSREKPRGTGRGGEERKGGELRTYNMLLNAWCERGDVEQARAVLREMRAAGVAPDAVSYNTLMKAYGRLGRPNDCERVLREMVNALVRPNARTFGMMVRALCDVGRMGDAEVVAERMREWDVAPNATIFNTIVKGYCQAGQPLPAAQVLQKMRVAGVPPDLASYCTLMNAWSTAARPDRARAVLQEAMAAGLAPDVEAFSVLAKGYLRARQGDAAERLLDEMRAQHGVAPNVVTYTTVMGAYCSMGARMDSAMAVYERMVGAGVRPNAFTFRTLIWGFCEARLPHRAEAVLRLMEAEGGELDARCYEQTSLAWQSVGLWRDAQRIAAEKRDKCGAQGGGARKLSKREERGRRVREEGGGTGVGATRRGGGNRADVGDGSAGQTGNGASHGSSSSESMRGSDESDGESSSGGGERFGVENNSRVEGAEGGGEGSSPAAAQEAEAEGKVAVRARGGDRGGSIGSGVVNGRDSRGVRGSGRGGGRSSGTRIWQRPKSLPVPQGEVATGAGATQSEALRSPSAALLPCAAAALHLRSPLSLSRPHRLPWQHCHSPHAPLSALTWAAAFAPHRAPLLALPLSLTTLLSRPSPTTARCKHAMCVQPALQWLRAGSAASRPPCVGSATLSLRPHPPLLLALPSRASQARPASRTPILAWTVSRRAGRTGTAAAPWRMRVLSRVGQGQALALII